MKKILKSLQEKVMAIIMVCAMLLNYMIPVNIVYAAEPAEKSSYGIIQIQGSTAVEDRDDATAVDATYTNGKVTVSGTGLYSNSTNSSIFSIDPVTINCTPNENYTCELEQEGTNTHGSTIELDSITPQQVINIGAIFTENTPESDKESTIHVTAGTGTYEITRPNQITGEPEVVEENYDDMIQLGINGTMWNPEDQTLTYGVDPGDTTVEFTFETLWINRFYENIVINNHSYTVSNYIDFDDRTSWLTHNNGSQMISFNIPNVPIADTYDIVVKHGENNGTRFLATFLWTADPAQAGGHDYIGNAKLEFVKAVYSVGETEYTVTEDYINNHLQREGDFMVASSEDGFMSYGVKADVNFDDGGITVPGEAEVTMRVVPKYGYQVTSVNGGNDFETTDDGVSEFTVVVHNGEAGYFQAEVTPVDNEVKSNSSKVEGGIVSIENNEIDAGTVVLTVDDVELSADKIKDFKKAAEGYEISSYLDINLSQILYKGTAGDVWSNQIHHLDNEATISLKLEEGINIEDVVIVHNIDDGDEFEVIEIDSWNPETRIITFKTKSFSNYAIATRPSSSETPASNPKTGDNIIFYFMIMLVCFLGIAATAVYVKKKDTSKKADKKKK